MTIKEHFELMASYNQWMNNKIYSRLSEMTLDDFNKDRGAFFNSLSGTLNHILVGDILWLKRFALQNPPFQSLENLHEFETPKSLDQILYKHFSDLNNARKKIDSMILGFTQEINDHQMHQALHYQNSKNIPFKKNIGLLIQHFFNHQTHHRGQISTLLTQCGIDIGPTDLLLLIPEADNAEKVIQ